MGQIARTLSATAIRKGQHLRIRKPDGRWDFKGVEPCLMSDPKCLGNAMEDAEERRMFRVYFREQW